MKLRLRGNSVRLRLTRPEVESLARGSPVEETTQFPSGQELRFRIATQDDRAEVSADFESSVLTVRMGRRAATQWNSGDEVGLERLLPLPHGGELRILIEKDFTCLHPGRGETSDDAYPHPAQAPPA